MSRRCLCLPKYTQSHIIHYTSQTMRSSSISRWTSVLLMLLGLAQAHTVITYPGYRGNNLHTNGTVTESNGLGVAYDTKNGSYIFPYGMEWIYPCEQDTFHGAQTRKLTGSRRWNAQIDQPNQMACQRWCSGLPAGLVSGPCDCLDLCQHGIRRDPTEHEPSGRFTIPDQRPVQRPLPGYCVFAPGASAGQYQC